MASIPLRSNTLETARQVLVSILLATTLTGILAGCEAEGQAAANAPPPPEVHVATVQREDVLIWGTFTGRVAAPETVTLRPRVSGYLEQIHFSEGTLVEAGDLLFVIDPRPYQARAQLAQAELERAQSQFALADSEAARARRLFDRNAISGEELEQRNSAALAAKAEVNAAEASLQTARLDLEYTQVRAPFSGLIGRAQLTRGNLATADTSVLATLVSVDPLHVYFEPDQQTVRNAIAIQAGTPVRVDNQFTGQLDFIDNHYDGRTGTLQYRALVPNPDGALKPGQFARVEMPLGSAGPAILLDEKAVLTDQDRRYVYVLDNENRASRRFIEPGPRFHGLLVIEKGLNPGEKVAVNGLQKIVFPGMEVSPQLVTMDRADKSPVTAGLVPEHPGG